MSITITTDLVCDRCHSWATGVSGTTIAAPLLARKRLKERGWVCKRGHDLCPRCVKEAREVPIYLTGSDS